MYKIEKDVPIPRSRAYPFQEMEIGDSFFVSCDGYQTQSKRDKFRVIGCRIIQSLRPFRQNGKKFITRTDRENNGIRCWRIE